MKRDKSIFENIMQNKNLSFQAKGFYAMQMTGGPSEFEVNDELGLIIDELIAFGLIQLTSDGMYEVLDHGTIGFTLPEYN